MCFSGVGAPPEADGGAAAGVDPACDGEEGQLHQDQQEPRRTPDLRQTAEATEASQLNSWEVVSGRG